MSALNERCIVPRLQLHFPTYEIECNKKNKNRLSIQFKTSKSIQAYTTYGEDIQTRVSYWGRDLINYLYMIVKGRQNDFHSSISSRCPTFLTGTAVLT